MARMIPDIDPQMIENDGEREFYRAAKALPNDYTVLYSFKYRVPGVSSEPQFGEADFVIVHPALGFAVIEVKMGHTAFLNGMWQEEKNGSYRPMHNDPVEQGRNSMWNILNLYKAQNGGYFPLKYQMAVCFPETIKPTGAIPPSLTEDSILIRPDLEKLEAKLLRLFGVPAGDMPTLKRGSEAARLLVKTLTPSFRAFARLNDQIDVFDSRAKKVMYEEQERILDETELDKRKVFLGAAGTGKTFLAIEKAKRLSSQGLKVFLTCFNRNLGRFLASNIASSVTCSSFLDYLETLNERLGLGLIKPEDGALDHWYQVQLPDEVELHYMDAPDVEKFDAIVVDEGQDFRRNWYECLECMLKPDGHFYVFADPNQTLFDGADLVFNGIPVSKHRLTRNLRNTEYISNWIGSFVSDGRLKPGLSGGIPIISRQWSTPEEERELIKKDIGALVSQGMRPSRIVILSPHTLKKSSLADRDRIGEWPLVDLRDINGSTPGNAIRFATIRSFKGLEADVVLLIGLKRDEKVCSERDIYVGGSRARFILYVYYNREAPPEKLPAVRA